uniref:Odorant receptor n=1 Tax=Colaphellus bowringi TaxID=561076 RepID=A0A0S3J2P6_9CUCU|nr:odorant receptor OR36 [Colaphellus bowringi]
MYFFYVSFLYGTGVIFFVCEFMIFNETIGKISKFVSHIGMLFTHVVGILKMSILIFGRYRILKIMNVLQNEKYHYAPLEDSQPGLLVVKEKFVSSGISILVFVLYTFVGVSAHISSLITINEEIKGDSFEGTNKTCHDYMPYFFYIPFPTETKGQCGIAFAFMDVGLGIFAWVIACHDGVFVGLLNCLKTQLLIVCNIFTTIRARSLKAVNLPKNYKILHDEYNPALEKELYRQLSHCTEHLKLLLVVRDDLEIMFTFVTLSQTLASLLIFASCLYVASTVPMTSPEFFAQMEYFLCVLVQLSLICWFGNEITRASELIRLSLYESDWLSCSRRFKSSMILTMIRMQRPVYLSIGKFSPLTLATLVAVCRGSFSYFALFKSVQ